MQVICAQRKEEECVSVTPIEGLSLSSIGVSVTLSMVLWGHAHSSDHPPTNKQMRVKMTEHGLCMFVVLNNVCIYFKYIYNPTKKFLLPL